jgi:nucleotide-binding universal stress UspA family protein
MRRILLAVDETDASARAAAFVDRFFGDLDVAVTAVNVARAPIGWATSRPYAMVPPVPFGGVYAWPFTGADRPVVDTDAERAEREARAVATTQAPPGADVDVAFGDPVEAIARAADDHDADLIVVGSEPKGTLQRWLGGSVSNTLTREAPRPVLAVG